ncbi:MAG: serine/threonine protein kinase [Rivularia sp. (in: Bacteria)]|nr:serine/threonine protein kinase [Rivularia sp. MS3]
MLKQEIDKMLHQKYKTELDQYIGKFVNHRYLIRDLIGKGGGGKVYLAEDCTNGGMPVAVKILSLKLDNQTISQRFAREIFISTQLGRKSKHIVRVLGYGITDDKIPFYVMEYLQGKNLLEVINNQPLSLEKFFDITYQICQGLQCAHEGISVKGKNHPVIHRDIKPQNIFITQDVKKGEIAKILDFGIAKFLKERAGATLSKSFFSSLPYCSPEHMEGRKLLDIRSDIYSLGIIMYQMLYGKHPFQLKSDSFGEWYQAHRFETPSLFSEVIPEAKIPLDLEALIISCLSKDIKNRPQNITQILETLQLVQNKCNKYQEKNDIAFNHEYETNLTPATLISKHICLQKKWPDNKPIAPVVFPHLLYAVEGKIPTFWAMLPQAEIAQFLEQKNTTEFVQKINIYPMIMWVAVLHDTNYSLTRWLSCFLDITDKKGERMVKYLAEKGYYHLLLFALEKPEKCAHVITITITPHQREQLFSWLEISRNSKSFISPNQSQTILKAQYEKIKPKILQKIADNRDGKSDIKALLCKFLNHLNKFFQF